MSEVVKTFTELLAQLPSSDSVNDKNVVLSDGSKIDASMLFFKDLNGKESSGSIIGVKEFSLKYLSDACPGTLLSSDVWKDTVLWNIALTESLIVSTQYYTILLLKNVNGLKSPWSILSFVLLPNHITYDTIYIVNQCMYNTLDDYQIKINKITLSEL